MQPAFIRRGRIRIPAIHLGGGLLKPVPQSGHDIVVAARNAEIDRTLGKFNPDPVPPVTVIIRGGGGGGPVWGGNGLERDALGQRTKLERLPVKSRRPHKSWKYARHNDVLSAVQPRP